MSGLSPANATPGEPGSSKLIPSEPAIEIRRLAHDLSNALEIILQSSYLLGTVELDETVKPWVGLLNQSCERALEGLLELPRLHSAKQLKSTMAIVTGRSLWLQNV